MEATLEQFVAKIIAAPTPFTRLDQQYVSNRILALIGDGPIQSAAGESAVDLVAALVATAVEHDVISGDASSQDILESQLMDLMTPLPSTLNQGFWDRYQQSPQLATDWFYRLSCDNSYIRTRDIAKNVVFDAATAAGDLEITINLSKPEKDPKAIAAARNAPTQTYPLDQLCLSNEGYRGRLGYPARSNHRIIRLMLGGESWGFQYSPYAYFKEHAIFLSAEHRPMVINQRTITNLLEIIQQFPTYFVGSNADLPIVGDPCWPMTTIRGKHVFPMMKAPIDRPVDLGIAGVTAGVVKWPMTDIRLRSATPASLVAAADRIMTKWLTYSDESVDVRAFTEGVRHHTVTPIAWRDGSAYVLDLVLRDNQTSAKYPDGIFHPHQDVQHIKKENIGLIEVMGRAILPARLKTELAEVAKYVCHQPNHIAAYHQPWADALMAQYAFNPDNATALIRAAVGRVFARVLSDAGVFKQDSQGQAALDRFIKQL